MVIHPAGSIAGPATGSPVLFVYLHHGQQRQEEPEARSGRWVLPEFKSLSLR